MQHNGVEEMGEFTYLKNVVTLRLDEAKCVRCGMCLMVCPHAVLGMDNGNAFIADRDACMECGACRQNCEFEAIELSKGTGCLYAIVKEDILKIAPKGSGCGCGDDGEEGCC